MFIIKPFNLVFFCFLAFIALTIIILTKILKNKSIGVKKLILLIIGCANIVLWIFYKIWLYQGVEVLNETGYVFNIYKELPLHMCNVSIILFVIGLLTDKKIIYSYCFYFAPLGALLAFVTPSNGFSGNSLFALHNVGYYFTHALIIINGILLVTLKLFKPNYKNALKASLMVLLLSVLAHAINYFFLYVCHQETDYFYTMHVTNISLLNVIWDILPIRLLYLLPPFILFGALLLVLTIPFELSYKKENKKNYQNN